jgi:hypothetical protein
VKKKTFLFVGIFIVILISVFGFFYFRRDSGPISELAKARESLTAARSAKALTYSSRYLREAESNYDAAMHLWKKENERFVLKRNYTEARSMAARSIKLSGMAIESANNTHAFLQETVPQNLDSLRLLLDKYQRYFKNIPLGDAQRKKFNKGHILYGEAVQAYESNDLSTAWEKASSSKILLQPVFDYCSETVKDYFQDYKEWEKLKKNALHSAKKGNSGLVIVDKYARECIYYQGSKVKHTFSVELGKNWIGDKEYQGDNRTPEGLYKVSKKISGGATKYHKALLLDYPNNQDKERFVHNKKVGHIHASAKIGGLIEIHGHGGKGADWTEGCIALQDEDIDILFKYTSIGTPVLVIGSGRSLEEIQKLSQP